MDGTPTLTTAADLEMRAARVADPSTDLKTKLNVAHELREMIDVVREAEAARVIPHMVPILLDILRSGEVAYNKESLEFQFRRCLLEIIHRLPANEGVRPQAGTLFSGMLYLLRHDNEENGSVCCKIIGDISRSYRALTEELLKEYLDLYAEILRNIQGLVDETLSADSPAVDMNMALPARRSFKVLGEYAMATVSLAQPYRQMVLPALQTLLPLTLSVLMVEAPVQRKAKGDYEAMGRHWAGMAPGFTNPTVYADFTSAQIKMLSCLAFMYRGGTEHFGAEGETLALTGVRLLQDCPPTAISARRDLMVVFRHLLSTSYRRAVIPFIDKIFDDRVLWGTGAGCRDAIRQNAFACAGDLAHHLRGDMTAAQLTNVCQLFLRHLLDPRLPDALQHLCAKVIFGLIEPIITKDTQQGAARTLRTVLDGTVDKIGSMAETQKYLAKRIVATTQAENEKGTDDEGPVDYASVEKARPVGGAMYAVEKPADALIGHRQLVRTLMPGFRVTLSALKKCDAPVADGGIISRLFESAIRCIAAFDGEPREVNEALEWLGNSLIEVNLHVFQEVWTQKISFFFAHAEKHPVLMHLAQVLFSRESSSPTLVAIVLRFLVDHLPELGDYDDKTAAVAIRMFKLAFGAVGLFPQTNEAILASHLGKMIMDCFPLAAKATKPTNYFHLLRLLFRAIGGGGGRFELLYKEVLPLLPEMLDCLQRQLLASDGFSRDLVVELCLTVPLRLTHLLPYLSYLMRPLVFALRGTPDLVAQGLRTLELCIDNLTPEFLDPTLNTVLRELMEALHSHLKPLPANHHHAHTTMRILGKLGGRNRRLLDKEPALRYHHFCDMMKAGVSFSGVIQPIELGPTVHLAVSTLVNNTGGPNYRLHAYNYVEACLALLIREGLRGRDREQVFVKCMEGLYDAIHIDIVQQRAEKTLRDVSRHILFSEVRQNSSKEAILRRHPGQALTCYLDALSYGFARNNDSESEKVQNLVAALIGELVEMASSPDVTAQDIAPTLSQIAGRFSALCLEDSWAHKSAGCSGISVMARTPGLGLKWVVDRELDLVRNLLCVLKDMQYDLPRDVKHVVGVLTEIIRAGAKDPPHLNDDGASGRTKLSMLIGILMAELASSSAIVRSAAQKCVELLAELYNKKPVELLMPNRDRLLSQIYTKPLRALPYLIQIGMIEAVRYCITLQPPLPELNDELLRLLHETLALADADDITLIGRNNVRQMNMEIVKLRVACIRLLTASMPLTDFFAKQHQTRQRVTGVYFKSLYSPNSEVKEVAHEGLRMVLTHQSRLPKELLQTGLRPILMNLADPKRLSIPGLEGLARLLELLTNYFKVEIGHKLLDHFRVVADPQMLQASSRLPLVENEGITKLVRLANIFHLLPSAAHIFLENLVNAIVQTEAQMHFSGQSPFSEPLAKYLDRYPVEAMDFFMRHLHFPRHVRTFRSILQAKLADNLLRELTSRTSVIVSSCLEGRDPSLVLPGLLLCSDLAELVPGWLVDNPYVIEAVLALWAIEPSAIDPGAPLADVKQRYSLMISILVYALRQAPRIDLLFPLVAVFSRNLPLDVIHISQFLYQHVAFNDDLTFRRNVLARFTVWFRDPSIPASHKVHFIQYVVTPTLLVHARRSSSKVALLDESFVNKVHMHIWQPMNDDAHFAEGDDVFKVELLHLTTVMVHYYPEYLQDAKKDIIRCAWHYITSDDAIVKQTAYLLAARFFEAFEGPQKFHLRVWTGLLKPPHIEAKALVRQALDIIAPVLLRSQSFDGAYPQWARTTRRLLAEEGAGWQQVALIYHLIVRQRSLFYPVRALFVPHIVNYVSKLGLGPASHDIRTLYECRTLSVEILQVVFDWEQEAIASGASNARVNGEQKNDNMSADDAWITPLPLRESIVSYLVRLCTIAHDPQTRASIFPKALELLRMIVGLNGWSDVTFKLHFFSRALEQNELKSDTALLAQAQSSAKVLQVICAEKDDAWFTANASILTKLVRKGLLSEDSSLQDSLHVVFDRLIRLFPVPKEDEEQQTEASDFHGFIYNSISENLRNADELRANAAPVLRGILLMLKSVVQVSPERIEPYGVHLMKLLSRLAKDHIQSSQSASGYEQNVRLITNILEISQVSVAYLGEQRKWLLSAFVALVEKSKSHNLCKSMLDIAREWALNKRDPYPTMKEKATLLQKMAAYELRGERAESLFSSYLELIYDIYTDPSLRRTDLTTRLEQSFLLGCRAADLPIRERFIDLMDVSIPRSLFNRLIYVVGVQNWEALADHNWMFLAVHLLFGSIDGENAITPDGDGSVESPTLSLPLSLGGASSLVRPMQRLLYLDPQTVHDTWVSVFPSVWACLSRREQVDISHHLIALLSKDYHIKQAELRPNVIQTLLEGIHACSPSINLPPHLVKYLAKTFGAWHVSAEILELSLLYVREDEAVVRDTIYDSLAEVYAELAEDDVFYGLWRRRALYPETNTAIAFEQCGMWEQASSVYETAQSKTRAGNLPFSEAEFCLWEDHWMLAAEKLQQWEVLYDLARAENNHELMLESAWRTKDWADSANPIEEQFGQLPDVATPRRKVFEAFLALLKPPPAGEKNVEFNRILDDAMQLSLRKWTSLPPNLSAAHIPLLQHFQQFVELLEAVQIFGSLAVTNTQNLEKRSSDLKMVLQAWRERLPNQYDDISIWSDLVAWRQNVFNAINKKYLPLISGPGSAAGAGGSSAPTFGYRGYHETAWIINRFAHVARKHDLLDVCFSQLNRIYTLPNIEISEAFLKLREQARCHYQKPGDLQAGLEVINNTNLIYFSTTQKAEFYTLKAMFYAKFGRNEEASAAFGQAIQLDMTQSKGWAAWGKYNDRLFKENPNEMVLAAQAVHCYLQAAGMYKSRKSRPLLARVLWLLSVDDGSFTISRAFDTYKGDAAYWYWITLIPQLCLSLSQRELKQARYLLLNLAKLYPQALFFQLRTTKEDLNVARHQAAKAAAIAAQRAPHSNLALQNRPADIQQRADSDRAQDSMDSNGDVKMGDEAHGQAQQSPARPSGDGGENFSRPAGPVGEPRHTETNLAHVPRQSPDYVEEVVQILKTAFPLLILSMETMVDQISSRFRSSAEDEVYRLICVLLQEAMQQFVLRMNADDDGHLMPASLQSLQRLAQNLSGTIRKEWEEDFVKGKPSLNEFIQRLQRWRDKYERYLDARPRVQSLELLSHYLLEFQYGKWDDIEVPGQYTEEKDNNQNFVRLLKFGPTFENCRSHGYSWKRFSIHGHDHSRTWFAAQIPSAKHCRREERLMHLLRILNLTLIRKKESRKRNLHFHVPMAVPCSSSLRLLQNDASYITLGDIYDQHCENINISREDPILLVGEKFKAAVREFQQTMGRRIEKSEHISLKKDLLDEITMKMVPADILSRYMIRTMEGPGELWRMRKQFALQLAATSFMTFVFSLTSRVPYRFHLSRSTGLISMSELSPGMATQGPVLTSSDAVPFRLTPNLQHFVGTIMVEGILPVGIMTIGRCLTDPEYDLEQQLCLYARDEVLTWRGRPWAQEASLRTSVATLIDGVVKRAEVMACKTEREVAITTKDPQNLPTTPVVQTVTNLISTATNPLNLAKMPETYMPWF